MKTSLFTRKTQPDPETERLRQELCAAQEELQQAYHQLNLVVEPELVESCIYQISSIQARCNYLIRTIKIRYGAAADTQPQKEITWT